MENDLIEKALQPLNQQNICDDCGKHSEWLTTCTYPIDAPDTKLCPDCMKDSGFCLRCGHFSAGISSFDFSEIEGYCSDCVSEIKAEESDDDDCDGNWAHDYEDEEEDFPNGSLDY